MPKDKGKNRRKFTRNIGHKRYRKLFIIAVEGNKTEVEYFQSIDTILGLSRECSIQVKPLASRHASSARKVLETMQKYLKQHPLQETDEAWLVVDKDNNPPEVLESLFRWSCSKQNYGFALSNPKFEYWLLLHFEDVRSRDVGSSRGCSERLKTYLPSYHKGINIRQLNAETIQEAIARAKQRSLPTDNYPYDHVGTTVYRLVEKLFAESITKKIM